MENPRDLLRRALQQRRSRRPSRASEPQQAPPELPRYRPSHASYSALMRSHDRVSTRHIPGQG